MMCACVHCVCVGGDDCMCAWCVCGGGDDYACVHGVCVGGGGDDDCVHVCVVGTMISGSSFMYILLFSPGLVVSCSHL